MCSSCAVEVTLRTLRKLNYEKMIGTYDLFFLSEKNLTCIHWTFTGVRVIYDRNGSVAGKIFTTLDCGCHHFILVFYEDEDEY